jgi:hypothetical protein
MADRKLRLEKCKSLLDYEHQLPDLAVSTSSQLLVESGGDPESAAPDGKVG